MSVEARREPLAPRERAAAWARSVDWAPWRYAATVVVVTRLLFFLVAYAGFWFLSGGEGRPEEGWLDIWARWDASDHFFRVADSGYTGEGSDPLGTAFFPLFPMLLAALNALGLSFVVGGLLISAVASIVALAYLHKLAALELGDEGARRALLYLALFPTAVFLVAPYSESLFLAGAIAAFYFARRGQWGHVALPAAVATATRAAGLFLLVGLALEFLRRREQDRAQLPKVLAALVIGLAPALAFGAYLASTKGDFFYYLEVQRIGWQRQFTGPFEAFRATWETWNGDYPTNFIIAWRVEIIAAIVGVAAVLWALLRREWGYAGYMGTTMAALLTSSWYFSIPRMLLSLFPIVLWLASATRRSREAHELVLVSTAGLAMVGVLTYTRGAWFF